MRDIIEGPPAEGEAPPPILKRLMWFGLLAFGGIAVTATVAYALRAMLGL